MSTFEKISKAIEDSNVAFEEFKKVNDARLDAVKKGNDSLAAELEQKLAKIDATITEKNKLQGTLEKEIELQRERIEELESRQKSPGKTAEQKNKDEYKSAFVDWIRQKGQSAPIEAKMQECMRKDVTIGSSAGGGYAVPEEISREIQRLEKKHSPVRDLVKVVQVGTSDYKELINIRGATSGWVGESSSRTATNTPQLREVVPTHGELYAYPQVSEWSLDDIFFNVEQWLADEISEEFAIAEGIAVISGNASNKPTGMLNTTPVTTSDDASPKRAAAAYQYILGGADLSPAPLIDIDTLIDLIYTTRTQYRTGARYVMNSTSVGQVRKLKDTTGQYLWQPSNQAGEPASLLGYPVTVWEHMQDPLVGNFPVAFGNFQKGYTLADRVGMRITRDNVTNIGFVRFYVRRREGGIVTNNDAIKWLKCQ